MLHGLLALAAGGQQVLLRTHRAWMPSEAKARPYDAAVSKFHSIAFIFLAMPSALVPFWSFQKYVPHTGAAKQVPGGMAADHCLQLSRTDLSECHWPLQVFGAAGFQPTTWGTQGLAPVCRTFDHRTDFPRTIDLQDFQISLTVETGLSDDA